MLMSIETDSQRQPERADHQPVDRQLRTCEGKMIAGAEKIWAGDEKSIIEVH